MAKEHMKTLAEIFEGRTKDADHHYVGIDAYGEKWETNRHDVLRSSTDEKESVMKCIKGVMPTGLTVDRLYPENFFINSSEISEKMFKLIANHQILLFRRTLYRLRTSGIKDIDFKAVKVYDIPDNGCIPENIVFKFMSDYSVKDLIRKTEAKYFLGFNKSYVPCLMVQDSDYLLYTCLSIKPKPALLKIQIDNKIIEPLDWNQTKYYYETYKETEMNLPTIPKLKPETNEEEINTSADKLASEMLATLGIEEKKEKKEKSVPVKEEEVKKEEATVETAMPQEGEVTEDKPKRTRINKPKKALKDLTAVIESVQNQVPDDMTTDEVIAEIKQLSDLAIACNRRARNIVTKYIPAFASAADKLQKLGAVFQGKI